MNKLIKYLKTEIDVEFFTCVHCVGIVFWYAFLLYLNGIKEVSSLVLLEISILCYLIAWCQKLLFKTDIVYSKIEFKIRVLLWMFLPIVIIGVVMNIFGWFQQINMLYQIFFLLGVFIYMIIIWFVLEYFYREDTKKLNEMLEVIKEKNKKAGL